ncbi:hypothetical protein AnigIFM60653_002618 [Aspergillus niger]|nr:hypothetical protein AnigIFM49718_002098 [Aspergillus niger]GKZ75226.1 hypothetical protein AnigIFM50267_003332 [Aspergillus niger]GLA10306.1 hypothetical protein AnigIFM60653_002618 [Aspergillus niger]GLA21826.1 hypothetical protein AnigIFM62618_001676 [Aspergillus niger]GLA44631.1 hypothetical protein AnigIFM63309_004395 [Aspergillus niger]
MWRLDLVTKNDHGSSQLDMLRPKRQLCQGQPAGFSMLTVKCLSRLELMGQQGDVEELQGNIGMLG